MLLTLRTCSQYLIIVAAMTFCSSCGDNSKTRRYTTIKERSWTEIEGVSFESILNCQSNLFMGKLVEKRINEQQSKSSASSNQMVTTGIVLLFQNVEGHFFLVGTNDASDHECTLAQKLIVGKFYRVPEDIK